jgi:glycosyltransferase involved in cell wall biosynthesis
MNVACLVPYPLDTTPSQRFRVEQWANPLKGLGIHVDFLPFLGRDTMKRLYRPGHYLEKSRDMVVGMLDRAAWSVRRARDYDAVVIHREAILPGLDWVERYVSRHVPTVFDFDDAIWLPAISPANRIANFVKDFEKTNRILSMVSAVSAGCEYLAAHARRFNAHVHIVPTSIDLAVYSPPRTHTETPDVLEVGWTGSVTTAPYLDQITTALRKAAERLPMRLSVLGATDVRIPGVEVIAQAWTPKNELPVITTFDVGLKPLPREEWHRGKCPMKDIQYMALGIPCIATNFGTSGESIAHGESGYLCDTDDDWVDAIVACSDRETRERLGRAGRRVVEERYSSTVAAQRFAETLESAKKNFRSGRHRSVVTRASA